MLRTTAAVLRRRSTRAAQLCVIFLFIALTSAFQTKDPEAVVNTPKRLVTLNSEDFTRFTARVYHQLVFDQDTLDLEVLHKALKGYVYLKMTDQLTNDRYLTIVDMTKHCNSKRLWVIDLQEKKVVFNEMVAHGKYSGTEYASTFSNSHRSKKTSLGFYITGSTYYGRNGLSLKLFGIESGFNSNAFSRGVVIHGANYVSDNYIKYNQKIGRSFGCPAVSNEVNAKLVDLLKGGSCMFIYHSSKYYNDQSYLINSDLYIPAEVLDM